MKAISLIMLFSSMMLFSIEDNNNEAKVVIKTVLYYSDGSSYEEQFYKSGRLKSMGNYNIKGQKHGQWLYVNIDSLDIIKTYNHGISILSKPVE